MTPGPCPAFSALSICWGCERLIWCLAYMLCLEDKEKEVTKTEPLKNLEIHNAEITAKRVGDKTIYVVSKGIRGVKARN